MAAFFIFIGCLIFLGVKQFAETAKLSVQNRECQEKARRDNFNDSLQFKYEYETREQDWVFEELTGMSKEIIANILGARRDKVAYDPEIMCAGFMLRTAERAINAYRLNQEGYNLNPKGIRNEYQCEDVDLSIPADYITQGKLYLLSVQELETLTGLDFQRLMDKFALLNEEKMLYQSKECYKRAKGIMIRYYMESQGLQFYGMQDFMFTGNKYHTPIGKDDVNDDFSLDDCKNWGTPLEFVG